MPVLHLYYLSVFLFSIGFIIVVTKRSTIMMLMGIELMLSASNINLITFNQKIPSAQDGQLFSLFVMIVAVCEAAVGLAIILQAYRHYGTSNPNEINELKG